MLVTPKKAPSIAAATVPEYSTLIPAFSPLLIPLTTSCGPRSAQLGDRQLHAVGGAAFDRPAPPPRPVEHFAGHQRREVGDRVADAALLGQRGDDLDGAELLQLVFQGRQTGGVDAVVVGKQDLHAVNRGEVGRYVAGR